MTGHPGPTRRGVQIALGCLWLLDGLLQLQPAMFTDKFARSVIAPAAAGQPAFVSGPMHFFMHVFLFAPAWANSGIALTQLGLGALILWKRSAKMGLILAAAWGLFIWFVGEGLSGLASGHALLLMGSPGAALIYALLGLAVLPRAGKLSDTRPDRWLLYVWAAIWVVGAAYQLMPGQNSVSDVSTMIYDNVGGAPSWLASADIAVAGYVSQFGDQAVPAAGSMAGMPGMGAAPVLAAKGSSGHSSGFGVLLAVAILQVGIGLGVFIPGPVRRAAVVAGGILSLGFWAVGQSFGSLYSGMATDPNTGPLLVILGIAVYGCTQRDARIRAVIARVKKGALNEMQALNEG